MLKTNKKKELTPLEVAEKAQRLKERRYEIATAYDKKISDAKKDKMKRTLESRMLQSVSKQMWDDDDYDEVAEKIENYFKQQMEKNEPPVISGIVLALGTNPETFRQWRADDGLTQRPPAIVQLFRNSVLMCEDWIARNMLVGKSNPVASIFTLKNNFGWKDKTETDITSNGNSLMSQPITIKMPQSIIDAGAIEGNVSKTLAESLEDGSYKDVEDENEVENENEE